MLVYCWSTVYFSGSTLHQLRLLIISCSPGSVYWHLQISQGGGGCKTPVDTSGPVAHNAIFHFWREVPVPSYSTPALHWSAPLRSAPPLPLLQDPGMLTPPADLSARISPTGCDRWRTLWQFCLSVLGLCWQSSHRPVSITCSAISQQTRDNEPMLGQCWADVVDSGPTLNQDWFNVSCLLG